MSNFDDRPWSVQLGGLEQYFDGVAAELARLDRTDSRHHDCRAKLGAAVELLRQSRVMLVAAGKATGPNRANRMKDAAPAMRIELR